MSAQYTLAVSGGYTVGFNSKNIRVSNTPVSQNWHQGYQVNLMNGYQFADSPIELTSRVGMKYMASRGDYQNIPFQSQTYKVLLGLGILYHFDSPLVIGTLFTLENNLDFDAFVSQTSDLFRYSFQTEFFYPIATKIDALVHYSLAFTPLADLYLVTNPQHQLMLGLRYSVQ